MTLRLVLASNNAHKLAELGALLAPLGIALQAQAALGVSEAPEPHATFIENALAKARHAAMSSGCAAIADDSGLCVDALNGLPGVASAHYAEPAPGDCSAGTDREARRRTQDAANNRKLLNALQGVADRRAHYVCTLVALRAADDPQPLVAVGRWAGVIAPPAGDQGFGYDPLMHMPALSCSVAQLPPDVKNAHSHRAQAAQQMVALMREVWRLG